MGKQLDVDGDALTVQDLSLASAYVDALQEQDDPNPDLPARHVYVIGCTVKKVDRILLIRPMKSGAATKAKQMAGLTLHSLRGVEERLKAETANGVALKRELDAHASYAIYLLKFAPVKEVMSFDDYKDKMLTNGGG